MSAHRPVWLYCDAGDDCEPSGDGSLRGEDTVREARDDAKRDGWHVTRGVDGRLRDVCPRCWKNGRR